jgi:hypothetical protein
MADRFLYQLNTGGEPKLGIDVREVGLHGAPPQRDEHPDGPDCLVTKVRAWRVRSRVEQFAAIRRDHRVDGLSIRALADKHHVHAFRAAG